MHSGTTNMTTGNVKKVMLAFAMPIFLSQLFQQLYNAVDSLIVGNLLGKQALAAVSSSAALIQLFTALMVGVALGAGVVGENLALEIVDTWLGTEFSGDDRHQRRINKLMAVENK
mgnify:CR=1 FL=1